MIGISLTHRGAPVLRLGEQVDDAAVTGRAVGLPLLYPWANRLRGTRYQALGRVIELDPNSPWLLKDWNGTILHGVPWSRLRWQTLYAGAQELEARMLWDQAELLQVFPFRHELRMLVRLDDVGLMVITQVIAGFDNRVPVSFGFHPYLGLPGLARERWRLTLPAMEEVVLDKLLIPTGRQEPFDAYDGPFGALSFDHGFAFISERPTMSISGGGRRVSVEFLEGYRFAQIYAQPGLEAICLEPMTAPTNALVTGEALPIVEVGERYRATFRISLGPG